MATYKVVLLRHGESEWNKKNLFSGWMDPSLTRKGVKEAEKAGRALKAKHFSFDIAFTNLLQRSIRTTKIVLGILEISKIPMIKTWRLNERHYGALMGLNRAETARKYGDKQVHLWRRSYSVRPPALTRTDRRFKFIEKNYPEVPRKCLPLTESLADTCKRTVPFWKSEIVPAIKQGKRVLVSASHNSLRSLVKHIDKIPDRDIPNFTIPTGVPLVYELDKNLKPIRHYYLGSAAEIKKSLKSIAAQGKAGK